MAAFLKSALGEFIGTGGGADGNDFVGQYVELGDQKLRVKRLIAEGKTVFFMDVFLLKIAYFL